MVRPGAVGTDDVRKLLAEGAQVVEVLPEADHRREHLPGAVSIPLDRLNADSTATLDRTRPVIVYCYDHECDLSSRAAALLVALGFDDVRDYVPSKTAWLGAGLPIEGTRRVEERAGALADEDVATVRADDDVAAVANALAGRDDPVCVVLDEERIVLGVVRANATALAPSTPVLDVLAPAPPSVRPSILRRPLAASMDRDGEAWVLVTTSHGELIGIVTREALRRAGG